MKLEGRFLNCDASNLVRGEIIKLDSSIKDEGTGRSIIPADCVILECSDDFLMDRSILTGDAKVKGSSEPSSESFLAANNTGLLGTDIISGHAIAVVVNVGDFTEWVKLKYPERKKSV